MDFRIEEIRNKRIWEDFLRNVKEKSFLQSFNWGEFNKMMGDKIWRIGIYKQQATGSRQQELISTALVIKITAKRGVFLFLPHGPNIKRQETNDRQQVLILLLEELKKIAKTEKASFIRIAPLWERNIKNIEIFKELGFREAPIHIHPELTWELDLNISEEELLKKMRKTTRYLIKRAKKEKGIEIIRSKDIKDIEEFNKLYRATKKRHQFVPFSLNYLKNEFLSFLPDNEIFIFLGKYKNEIVSSGIFIFWQDIGFYHHGASSFKYPKIPVSYQLLSEAIKTAKERGCKKFNFWGIAPISDGVNSPSFKKHPWAGLTLFKMGFGGGSKEYMKTQDFILSKRYWMSFFIEKLRRIKRSL
ncbi:MAG: lipid II:glycine glycyltransferase FemX [Candidatus Nealsonbacteria bacterium]